ncbi:glycogen debranching protein GlgX [Paralimibaculum aggregatum]|uniref:Glycogen debranching protein GlgX n=1 Tax=Paralimibaculum aggregatum TaxID=3036245 RepID=A0ABQ6LPM1_9RHOB|nr:glycogen debranching protein GlgX [Limibaculum sp. NKW23]GMG82634.1 glycogen debranching protein GlgX [Limibaculum sp. NKW23]
MIAHLQPGSPNPLGASFDGEGTNFAVYSANARKIELCLFSADGARETARHALPERTGHVWHGYKPGLPPGTLYGYRAHGSYAPERGHRFNPHKLLLDPYTREFRGRWSDHPATRGYDENSPQLDLSYSACDSAPHVPKSVVSDPALFPAAAPGPGNGWSETLIYEAHVKGLTRAHPGVPEAVRGTYDGLASEAMLEHLLALGITAVELLPVHAFVDEGFLLRKRLSNYWGYNSIGFFAPEPRYFGPSGLAGFRAMVERFHAAGIEVILDVVYNHTAEGDHRGPTLCYRGLDNAAYYRLLAGQPRYYVNDTGCGNTLDVSNPFVLRMVMDSLRFWVQHMGIDGFRFDLATALAREEHGFDRNGGFLDCVQQDPVLAGVKLIAEPWDIGPGGYRLGEFPNGFAEWNDQYRDAVRKYWRGDSHSTQGLAARLLGSAGEFDRCGRRSWASVNMLTAHDGFTLADVTRYNERHNLANGESGADGHNANFSDNCGVEGPSDDPAVCRRRMRRQRNLLATLFLSQGTPMLLGGDEIGNSQDGNNNAYCQDNPTGWIDWAGAGAGADADADGGADAGVGADLLAFVQGLARFRAAHPAVRQTVFLHGALREADGKPDVEWHAPDGNALQWRDPGLSRLSLLLRGSAETAAGGSDGDAVFIVFNRDDEGAEAVLPEPGPGRCWVRRIDTAAADAFASAACTGASARIAGSSVTVFTLAAAGSAS